MSICCWVIPTFYVFFVVFDHFCTPSLSPLACAYSISVLQLCSLRSFTPSFIKITVNPTEKKLSKSWLTTADAGSPSHLIGCAKFWSQTARNDRNINAPQSIQVNDDVMGLVEETLLTAGMHRPVMRNDTEIDIDHWQTLVARSWTSCWTHSSTLSFPALRMTSGFDGCSYSWSIPVNPTSKHHTY